LASQLREGFVEIKENEMELGMEERGGFRRRVLAW